MRVALLASTVKGQARWRLLLRNAAVCLAPHPSVTYGARQRINRSR